MGGECNSYRGISLLCEPGKVYGRILTERLKEVTEGKVSEEQGIFWIWGDFWSIFCFLGGIFCFRDFLGVFCFLGGIFWVLAIVVVEWGDVFGSEGGRKDWS